MHLQPDKLEARDLTLGLFVGPKRSDRGSNRYFILRDVAGKRGDETGTATLDPWE